MKILALNRPIGTPLNGVANVDIIPDSALIKDRKPFFMPDFSTRWTLDVTLAYRVSRLGKNVAEKFANRYYDAMTLMLRARPLDLIDSLGSNSSAVTTAFDGAAIMGQWMPIPENRTVVDLTINGELYEINLEEALIDDVVADMSRYFTLKIGDIIIAGATPHSIEAVIDSSVTATLNGKECLNFKVK